MAKRLTKIKINEVSSVDVPAQEGAVAAILKGYSPGQSFLTTMAEGHQHLVVLDAMSGYTSYVEQQNSNGYSHHKHPYVVREDGSIEIGAIDGHTHTVVVMGDEAEEDSEEMILEKKMTSEEINQLIAGLSVEQFTYLRKNLQKAQEFLKMDQTARQALVAQDSVVYTDADGTQFFKSDDQRLVNLAKSRDEDRRQLAEERARTVAATFEKNAKETLGNLPGEVATKAALLKAVAALPNEQQAAAMEILVAADNAHRAAFNKVGTREAPATSSGNPEQKLQQLAKAYSDANRISPELAMAKVLETQEGQQLYAAMIS